MGRKRLLLQTSLAMMTLAVLGTSCVELGSGSPFELSTKDLNRLAGHPNGIVHIDGATSASLGMCYPYSIWFSDENNIGLPIDSTDVVISVSGGGLAGFSCA